MWRRDFFGGHKVFRGTESGPLRQSDSLGGSLVKSVGYLLTQARCCASMIVHR